jgi:hypothetical protein
MAVGLGLLTELPAHGTMTWTLVPALLVLGVAIPCSFASAAAVALDRTPLEHAGLGSGHLKALQWIGGAFGLALVAAASGGLDTSAAGNGALFAGVRAGFAACTVLASLGVAVSCAGLARARRPQVSPVA